MKAKFEELYQEIAGKFKKANIEDGITLMRQQTPKVNHPNRFVKQALAVYFEQRNDPQFRTIDEAWDYTMKICWRAAKELGEVS